MDALGAKAELVRELRRVGPRMADAARNLGVSIRLEATLADDQFALDTVEGKIWGGSEEAVWAGIAHFLALDLAIEADLGVLWDAASAITRRSGTYLQIA